MVLHVDLLFLKLCSSLVTLLYAHSALFLYLFISQLQYSIPCLVSQHLLLLLAEKLLEGCLEKALILHHLHYVRFFV